VEQRVRIVEVGPRDGLQNEPGLVPLDAKIAFIDALSRSGLSAIEATSFVSPKAVPQMADAGEVMAGVSRVPGIDYLALVPNERGMDRAVGAGIDVAALFTSATEEFCQANIRCSIEESLARFEPVVARAKAEGIAIRGYLSVAFVCPFSGDVPADAAARVAERLFALGCDDLCLADTIGRARPEQVHRLISMLASTVPIEKMSLHVHDTDGRALENIDAALALGLRTIDSSAGGLGGCPFAPGAPGNVATEKVLAHLEVSGFETGVDSNAVAAAFELVRPYTRAGAP
jgi:isopropylmalate/homocitrate/citramalate synthase